MIGQHSCSLLLQFEPACQVQLTSERFTVFTCVVGDDPQQPEDPQAHPARFSEGVRHRQQAHPRQDIEHIHQGAPKLHLATRMQMSDLEIKPLSHQSLDELIIELLDD